MVGLNALIRTAGVRWKVEEAFQTGKALAGLDEHQGRRYVSWARWTVLVMLAHAFLTVVAAEQPDVPARLGLIPLTRTRSPTQSRPPPTIGRTRPATGNAGQHGDDTTSTPPSDATTSDDGQHLYDTSRTSAGVLGPDNEEEPSG